jgi:hypothetical protein
LKKAVLFSKKNQKPYESKLSLSGQTKAKSNKSFLLLFFKKAGLPDFPSFIARPD